MTTIKRLGICMDHASAQVMEYTTGLVNTSTVDAKTAHEENIGGPEKGEKGIHNKQQHDMAAYYKELGELIREYNEVVLFGPTDAKAELYNLLRKDHRFEHIKIEVKQTDKMTENQQHAFVMEHFAAA